MSRLGLEHKRGIYKILKTNKILNRFIEENKTMIDAYIEAIFKKPIYIDEELRTLWVNHDEWLYNLAKNYGVRFKKEKVNNQ